MNRDFAHTITLLRKEKKLTQKEAASSLGISQALLSHYEKGIRECSLSFVIKAAEFYGVSCDYLLGRTAERQYDITDLSSEPAFSAKQNAAHMVNQRLVNNTIGIIYDCLSKAGNRKLTRSVTNYLMLGVYQIFRQLCHANPSASEEIFTVDKNVFRGYTAAAQEKLLTDIENLCCVESEAYVQNLHDIKLSPEQIAEEYPEAVASLYNVIRHAESAVNKMR